MSKTLREFTQDLLKRVGEGLTGLLGSEVGFTQGKLSAFAQGSLQPFGEAFVAACSAVVTGPHEGTVYICFDLPRVVVVGALLETVPPTGIEERLAEPVFDEDNADAFEEVGDIIVGKVDEVIRENLGNAKIHTKKEETLHGPPTSVFDIIQAQGEYYCLEATLNIHDQEPGPVAFLFHSNLIEEGFQVDPREIASQPASAITRKGGARGDDEVAADATEPFVAAAQEEEVNGGGTGISISEIVDGETAEVTVASSGAGDAEATEAETAPREFARSHGAGISGIDYAEAFGLPHSTSDIADKAVLLVVDDDITTRAMIRTYLDGSDITIFEAVSWREAGLFLRSHRVDTILLDLYLRDLNGVDACRKLHLHPATRDVPIILSTSRPSRDVVLKGLKAGASGFLIKPFNRTKLFEKLDSLIQPA